jgi:NAD(P)-dependent dehydrogenase (short-subunit alcohol dehydrogenase family)
MLPYRSIAKRSLVVISDMVRLSPGRAQFILSVHITCVHDAATGSTERDALMTETIARDTPVGMKRFVGRTALVTGGGTGMGRAAALRLGLEGANVVVAGRRAAELETVVGEIASQGGKALAVPTDVAVPDQVEALVDKTLETFGSLDLAWNNAGVLGAVLPVHELTFDDFDTLMAINLRGVFACLKYEIAAMLARGIQGSIVNTSSWTAHGAMPGIAGYAASKGALDAMMRTVAMEIGDRNIRVNNVSPGIIATPMARAALGDDSAMRPFAEHTPLRRVGTSVDVADVVLWLLSGDARFVTGQSIYVDGGYTLGGLRPWTLPQ